MNVATLIAYLQKLDPEEEVVCEIYREAHNDRFQAPLVSVDQDPDTIVLYAVDEEL